MAIFIIAVFCLIAGFIVYTLIDAILFGGDKVAEEAMRKRKLMIEREKNEYKLDKMEKERLELIAPESKVKERKLQEWSYKYED